MKGSVLLEFAIVLPLLLVFFLGISGIGQLLGHVTWISQTTYAAAMFAADVPQTNGQAKVQLETEKLKEAQNRGQVSGTWDAPVYSTGSITGKPIVSVSVPAQVTPLVSSIFGSNIGVSVAAPYLVPNQAAWAGFNDFGNPAGVVTCYAKACEPPAPYNPGLKKILSFGETMSFDDKASNVAWETMSSMMSGANSASAQETYDKLAKVFSEEINNDPNLARAFNTLDPSKKKTAKTTVFAISE